MVMHLDEVEIIDFEDVDLHGATVIAGFPSIGLVSTIAANYLIDALNLKQIGCMQSSQFPALSVVHTGEPLSPVRIYAGTQNTGEKIAVFVSEFKPKTNLIDSISNAIMKWSTEKGCKLLISPEGMVVEGKASREEAASDAYAIGSTESARRMLVSKNIAQFKNGIKVYQEIQKKTSISLDLFLGSASIPLVGQTTAKKITTDIDSITKESLMKDGIGDKASSNLIEWLKINTIPEQIKFIEQEKPKETSITICVSGRIKNYTKASLAVFLEDYGIKIVGNVTKEIDYLISQEQTSAKAQKAIKLNKIILTFEEFKKEIKI